MSAREREEAIMVSIRYVQEEDKAFWFKLDKHLPVSEFEKKIRDKMGYGMLMTSTQVDEDAQHFYKKMGYKGSGGLIINIPGYEQPMEMFFVKEI